MPETITDLRIKDNSTETATAGVQQLSMQQALNRALDEILAENPKAVIFGEDCGQLGGVFRITDGSRRNMARHASSTPRLPSPASSACPWAWLWQASTPIPEVQFDGFAYPAINQIVCQIARMNYRSRGTLPMPITLRVPSFGGIRAPEHHGESWRRSSPTFPGSRWSPPPTRTTPTTC